MQVLQQIPFGGMAFQLTRKEGRKEGNVLFKDT